MKTSEIILIMNLDNTQQNMGRKTLSLLIDPMKKNITGSKLIWELTEEYHFAIKTDWKHLKPL